MTEHDPERGLFKQLVLIAFGAWVWLELKIEQWRDSEMFWWCLCVVFALLACLFLKCTIAR